MEQQHNNNNREEQEVDLVPVFVWISKGFKNFFNGIGSFFKAIGHGILLFLAFIQANIILIGVFVIVGLALGFYFDGVANKSYTAQLRVAPNFKSSAQLISNINYYNSLAMEEDYAQLATELEITNEQAATLGSFKIKPSYNDTELLEEYDELAKRSDTMALKDLTFYGFKNAKREIDYEFYLIELKSINRPILEEITDQVIKVKDNASIISSRKANRETTTFNIESQTNQLREIDSLLSAYKKAIGNDNPSNSSTNLYLGDQKPSEAIKNLFDQKSFLLKQLAKERTNKYQGDETVNIVSQYITQGSIEKEHRKLKIVVVFLGFALLIAASPIVWRFLKSYPTDKNQK